MLNFTGRLFGVILAASASVPLAACVEGSHVMLGTARSSRVPPSQVAVYLEPIAQPYDEIAVLRASSKYSWSLTTTAKGNVVIARLQEEAAKLGANGILLQEMSSGASASITTGLAPDVTRDHATLGVGLDASGFFSARVGRAIAIYRPATH